MTQDVRGLVIKLTAEQDDREEVERQLCDRKGKLKRLETENSNLKTKLAAAPTEKPEPEQKSASASEPPKKALPDGPIILSKLRGKRKKSTATLDDVEAIVEIIEKS